MFLPVREGLIFQRIKPTVKDNGGNIEVWGWFTTLKLDVYTDSTTPRQRLNISPFFK